MNQNTLTAPPVTSQELVEPAPAVTPEASSGTEAQEPVASCVNCDTDLFQDDACNSLANDDTICATCRDQYTSVCYGCDGRFYDDDLFTDNENEVYCDPCRDNGYGDWGDDDDEDEAYDNDVIYCHDAHVLSILGIARPPATQLLYGFELELNTNDSSLRWEAARTFIQRVSGQGMVKADGSIGGGASGIELVSAPLSLNALKALVETALPENQLHPAAFPDYTCGMHVHVSRHPLALCQLAKLVRFIHSPANYGFMERLAGRALVDSKWAAVNQRTASWRSLYDPETRRFDDGHRYCALNLTNYDTIEFRIFASTTEVARVCANLEACAALVAFCGVAQRSILDTDKHEAFIAFVERERRSYPNLTTLLPTLTLAQ